MITRQEAKQIVDFVVQEIRKRQFPYITDGKVDFSKTTVSLIGGGTAASGGQINDGAIYDRHVNNNADIRGTKVRVATTSERGAVELETDYETTPGLAVQGSDPRLHDVMPSGSTQHDTRYYTETEIGSTVSGLGASLVGVYDGEGEFTGDNVEEVLHELFALVGAVSFLDLVDTPSQYTNFWSQIGWIPAINNAQAGLEFKPIHYIDGGTFTDSFAGAVTINETPIDGGSFTENHIMDGGNF